jgi:hypothetical protein
MFSYIIPTAKFAASLYIKHPLTIFLFRSTFYSKQNRSFQFWFLGNRNQTCQTCERWFLLRKNEGSGRRTMALRKHADIDKNIASPRRIRARPLYRWNIARRGDLTRKCDSRTKNHFPRIKNHTCRRSESFGFDNPVSLEFQSRNPI